MPGIVQVSHSNLANCPMELQSVELVLETKSQRVSVRNSEQYSGNKELNHHLRIEL